MGKYILKRFALSILTILGVTIVAFSFLHLIPGDPITTMFGQYPNKELVETVKAHYGLDRPILYQYFLWLKKAVKLDLGTSIVNGLPVTQLVFERVPRTIILAFLGIFFSMFFTIPFGIISANKRNTTIDMGISSFSLFLLSIPEWWWGIALILIFAVQFRLLPSGGYVFPTENFCGYLKTLILPGLALGLAATAGSTRMLRTTMIDALQEDYVLLMKSYGVRNFRILLVHAFRNAILPVITLVGVQFGYLLGGEVIIEKIFAYPGLGLLTWQSLAYRDYPVVQAAVVVFSFMFIVINFIVDILYGFINPQIRYK